VADKARELMTMVRPGPTHARRALPIRRPGDEIRRLWDDGTARAAVLGDMPIAAASIAIGEEVGDWGTVVTLDLELKAPMPGVLAQTMAGKAVRRLKSLAETGEVPTTEANPSARSDAS
jgi:hypothetical protein